MNEEALIHWGLLRQKKKEENIFTKITSIHNANIFFYFVELIASFHN